MTAPVRSRAPAPAPASADDAPAAVRWGGYLFVMAVLLGVGLLMTWRALRPGFVPGWLWWFFTGGHGQAYFASAVGVTGAMFIGVDRRLVARGERARAALVVALAVVGLGGVAAWSYHRELWLVAAVAAFMALVAPFARRLFPRLPRAQARLRS